MAESCVALGLDIGGANIKCDVAEVSPAGGFRIVYSSVRDFTPDVGGIVREILAEVPLIEAVGVTSTAEYGIRAFRTLADGIGVFKSSLESVGLPVLWMSHDGGLLENSKISDPYSVAAANWVASSLFIGRFVRPDCIFIDVGSTTTDIIPVKGGRPAASGRHDYERLGFGELVYTGVVNTFVPSIVRELDFGGGRIAVSAEGFSTAADAHLVLGNLSRMKFKAYKHDSVSPDEAYGRLARMVASNESLLGRDEIAGLAKQICAKQVSDVAAGIRQVWRAKSLLYDGTPAIVLAGLGARAVGLEAAKAAGFSEVLFAEEQGSGSFVNGCPAVAMGVLAGSAMLGGSHGR